MSRNASIIALLVVAGCSTHVGCSTRIGVSGDDAGSGDGSSATGSSASSAKQRARPPESMASISAGTYVASDPVFAPDNAGSCAPETLSKVEVLAKKAPWPDRPQAVDAFTIDKAVTTCSDYRACVASGACTPVDTRGKCRIFPAILVTIDQASAYCKWRGARLPTLLQWQAAVRGTTGKPFGKCDDDASTICTSTTESGVITILEVFPEFTSTRGCRSSHDGDGTKPRPVLAASYGHDLSGFVLLAEESDDPQTGAFRCARDGRSISNP